LNVIDAGGFIECVSAMDHAIFGYSPLGTPTGVADTVRNGKIQACTICTGLTTGDDLLDDCPGFLHDFDSADFHNTAYCCELWSHSQAELVRHRSWCDPRGDMDRPWTNAENRLLGRKPDWEVGRQIGRPGRAVWVKRQALSIPVPPPLHPPVDQSGRRCGSVDAGFRSGEGGEPNQDGRSDSVKGRKFQLLKARREREARRRRAGPSDR